MPSKISYIFIATLGILLVITGTYFVSDISTRKLFIRESQLLAYESILNIEQEKTDEFLLEKSKIDEQFEREYSINIVHKEAASWATLLLGILLVILAIFDYQLYRHRVKRIQTELIVSLVEENIEYLTEKRQAEYKTSNTEKWKFDKGIFIDNTLRKKIPHKLIINTADLLLIIDKVMDGTLKIK